MTPDGEPILTTLLLDAPVTPAKPAAVDALAGERRYRGELATWADRIGRARDQTRKAEK